MPILVRPVREQLEHDRIIRLLEAKWRRKFKVDANPGEERNVGVKVPVGTLYPDLVLTEEGGRKPKALIEVETAESVNHLEPGPWANFAKYPPTRSYLICSCRSAPSKPPDAWQPKLHRLLGLDDLFLATSCVTSVFRGPGRPDCSRRAMSSRRSARAAPAPSRRPDPAPAAANRNGR